MENNKKFNNKELEKIISNIKKINENLKLDFSNLGNSVEISENKDIEENINDEQEIINKKVEKHDEDIKEANKKLSFQNNLIIGLIVVLVISYLSWFYTFIYDVPNIKISYVIKEREFENKLELLKKDYEEMKNDLEKYREENLELKDRMKVEVEKDIYKTILQVQKN